MNRVSMFKDLEELTPFEIAQIRSMHMEPGSAEPTYKSIAREFKVKEETIRHLRRKGK